MQANRKNELLVGMFLLVGLAMMAAVIMQFGRFRDAFRETYELKVAFPNASGIKQGSPVFLGGSSIGRVKETPRLKPDSSGVVLTLEVYRDKLIPLASTFSVGSNGLMGDALVDIKIDTPQGPITEFYPFDYATVIEGDLSGGLSDLQSTASSAAKKVDFALDDVRIAMVDVKAAMKKINEGALSDDTVKDFRTSIEKLKSTMTRIDEQYMGEANASKLRDAIDDVRTAAASFKNSAASMEKATAKIEPMIDKLNPAIEKIDNVASSAESAFTSIKKGADDFATVARNANSGNGLISALMNDPELKNEFSDLISNLKRRGILFYRDQAAKDESATSGAGQRSTPNRPSGQMHGR